MRARITLEMIDDDGKTIATETVANLEKVTRGPEDLGLLLSQGKALLAKLQQKMMETQVSTWLRQFRERRSLRHNGYYSSPSSAMSG